MTGQLGSGAAAVEVMTSTLISGVCEDQHLAGNCGLPFFVRARGRVKFLKHNQTNQTLHKKVSGSFIRN